MTQPDEREALYESRHAVEGRYAELVVAVGLGGVHRDRGPHLAVLSINDAIAKDTIDALSAVLSLVSTAQARRRYERVIVIARRTEAALAVAEHIRSTFPEILTGGRLYSAIVEGVTGSIQFALGHAAVVSD